MLGARAVHVASCATVLVLGTVACGPGKATSVHQEQEGLPRAARWGDFQATRHTRTGLEVLSRARLVATVVLENDDLPSVAAISLLEIQEWEESARNDPFHEGAVRFELEGRDVLGMYRPATDRLTIAAMDTRVIPDSPEDLDPGIGEQAALSAAQGCMSRLEELGVLGRREFSTTPTRSSRRPVMMPSSSWVESYQFIFNPDLDGLPLQSAELVVTVNAWTETCQRITVGGQVSLRRLGDATVTLDEKSAALEIVAEKVMAAAARGVRDVRVEGEFGYYLSADRSEAVLSPLLVSSYSTVGGTEADPSVSREHLVGLPLNGPEGEELVDLLGPLL